MIGNLKLMEEVIAGMNMSVQSVDSVAEKARVIFVLTVERI